MTGFEGPAIGLGIQAAIAAAKRFAKKSEFDLLCRRLADRFSERVPLSASDYASWANDDTFMAALGSLVEPPYEFRRAELIAAITPLVGSVNDDTPAEAFAAELADAIRDEVQFAKTGDELVRFEAQFQADRIIHEVAETIRHPQPGGISVAWVPRRARRQVERLVSEDASAAQHLQLSLERRDLRVELPGLVADPPSWLRDGGVELWLAVARLAEVVGCWPAARQAHEALVNMPGADRVRALMAASGAAHFAGDSEAAASLRDRALALDGSHPVVLLWLESQTEDPERRRELLQQLGDPTDDEDRAVAYATRAYALGEEGDLDQAEEVARKALALAPELPSVREAPLAILLNRNRSLRLAGKSTQRQALLEGAEEFRRLRDDLRESRRFHESGLMLQRVAECQTLASRTDLALTTLGEALPEELASDKVRLEVADAALTAGDATLAERLLEGYEGTDPAAELIRAHAALRDPSRREAGLAVLDRLVNEGSFPAAFIRLTAAVPAPEVVPWSDAAERVVGEQNPALVSFVKAEWHERAGRPDEARRELARHAHDPRVLEQLMTRQAEQAEWSKAAVTARRLLATEPDIRARLSAAQVLRRAGAGGDAESVLRSVYESPDALPDERATAGDELGDELLRAGRLAEARELAQRAVADGRDDMRWVIAYTLAREGELGLAREQIDGLPPRDINDVRLAVDVHFQVDAPPDAVRNILALADQLPEPDEHVELRATMALMRCREKDVDSSLVDRAGPAQFVERFPASRALWQETYGDEQEVVASLRELVRKRTEAVSEAEHHVLVVGDWPVGALAGAVGMPLSVIWATLPTLPLAYADGPLGEEHDAVRAAAGGPAAVEPGTLHTLQLLAPEVVDAVLAEFPLSFVAPATLEDVTQASAFRLPGNQDEPHLQARWDTEAGEMVLTEVTAEEAQRPRQVAEAMRRLATRLQLSQDQLSPSASDTRNITARIYSESAELARTSGLAVYTDDRFFRRLLLAAGVPAFGTVAVLATLAHAGVLSPDQHAAATHALRKRGALGIDLATEGEPPPA